MEEKEKESKRQVEGKKGEGRRQGGGGKGKGGRWKMYFTLRICFRVFDLAYYTSRALPCFHHSLMKSLLKITCSQPVTNTDEHGFKTLVQK
jgi:hypothetical protein